MTRLYERTDGLFSVESCALERFDGAIDELK